MLVAEADEERNISDVGMSWLVRERPDLRCDFAINEGGGVRLDLAGGRTVVTVWVGEKIVTSLRLRVFGTAGHASIPTCTDNALLPCGERGGGLLAYEPPTQVLPAVAAALEVLGAREGAGRRRSRGPRPAPARWPTSSRGDPDDGDADRAADLRARERDPAVRRRDLRLPRPPGQDASDIAEHVERALGDGFASSSSCSSHSAGGTESPVDTPLYAALAEYVADRIPGAELLPLLGAGFTDSHYVRQAWGTVAYGFAPVIFGDVVAYMDAAHADDEAIEIADLAEMAAVPSRPDSAGFALKPSF